MKIFTPKHFLLTSFCLLSFLLYSQYSWQWTLTEGDDFNDYITATDCDAEGNIYLCGVFQDTVDFFGTILITAGGNDVFIAALDPAGSLLWVKHGGGEFEDIPTSLCITDGSSGPFVYVTGGFYETAIFGENTLLSGEGREMFLLQYDLSGNLNWAISGGGVTDDAGQSVVADQNGYAYVAGDFNYTATFGNHTVTYYGFTDAFLAKFDDEGQCLWATSGGGPVYDYGSCVATRGDHVYMAGSFSGDAIFGDQTITAVDAADTYIARYDTAGNFVEVAAAGGTHNERPTCMAVDEYMDVYLSGWFLTDVTFGWQLLYASGGEDVFLTKYTPGVGFTWAKSIGGSGDDEVMCLDLGTDNYFILAGTFENTIDISSTTLISEGYDDGFVTRFDADGNYDGAYQMGGTGTINVRGCAADPNGNYYLGGDFVDELKIGEQMFYPVGAYDLFLCKLGEGGIGIPEPQETSHTTISLWPNPTTGNIDLSVNLERDSYIRIVVRDAREFIIKKFLPEFHPEGKVSLNLNFTGFDAGMYFLILDDGKHVLTEKFLLLDQ